VERTGRPLTRGFYEGDVRDIAPQLLGKLLVHGERAGRIVEVEAYGGAEDPASHAYRGRTRRNGAMFGPPGYLYVYFTYGMHWCANVVCAPEGNPQAALIRALSPVSGLPAMRAARPAARNDRHLTNGPARLCQALGITGALDGTDLLVGEVRILDDGAVPPDDPEVSPRIGVRQGTDLLWRWSVAGDEHVSAPR
jgi:DNA-3-methyladenine glycosylase